VFGFNKDGRLIGLIDGLLVALGLGGSLLILAGDGAAVLVGLGLLGLGLLVVWVVFPAHYRLTEDELIVKTGPLRWRVPLAAIQRIEPTRAKPCATAWAFDSLRITYAGADGELMLLVAPHDRDDFLDRLQAAVPGLALSRSRSCDTVDT